VAGEGARSRDYLLTNAELLTTQYVDHLKPPLFLVELGWNERFTRSVAMAYLNDDEGLIEIGARLYPIVQPHRRDEVIAHELAHLAAWAIHGEHIRDHGPEWRALMRKLGFPNPSVVMAFGPQRELKGGLTWPRKRAPRARHSG
jgi:predicted SprT family Zn-dependent metalloprotease